MTRCDMTHYCKIYLTEFVLGFVPVNYTVQESGGSVEVCVAQTSSPPVQFARDVPLLFNTFNGMASG